MVNFTVYERQCSLNKGRLSMFLAHFSVYSTGTVVGQTHDTIDDWGAALKVCSRAHKMLAKYEKATSPVPLHRCL